MDRQPSVSPWVGLYGAEDVQLPWESGWSRH